MTMTAATTTRPRRRTTSGGTRRDELLAIAARVFAQKGIASATVRDIAQEAGILSGSLYHHFTSKEEMVKEIIGQRPAGGPDVYETIIDAAPDRFQALHGCILHAVGWVAGHTDVARILRNDAQYIRETPALSETETTRQSNRITWVKLVEAGMDAGEFRTDLDADVAVRAMWDGILASIRWFPPLGEADPATIGDQLATLYLNGIRA